MQYPKINTIYLKTQKNKKKIIVSNAHHGFNVGEGALFLNVQRMYALYNPVFFYFKEIFDTGKGRGREIIQGKRGDSL
jgi:hypothetical protein